jgi:hypothetical protein
MRVVLPVSVLVLLVSSASAYLHVPPQTLKAMCAESPQIRVLTVKARDHDKGVVVFETAEVLRAEEKSAIGAFRMAVRPDADKAKTVLDKLAVGATAILFSQEDGEGKKARGYGYAFIDDFAFSVDYNAQGELWLYLRAEPNLVATYYGSARGLVDLVKAVLKGKDVKVPTRVPDKADDLSLRGLLVEEARRKNSPTYPKSPLPTAWGKPAKGLQAGVRINPAVEIADAVVVLEVVIRNVDTKPRTFTHLQLAFAGESAGEAVTGKAEEYVSRFMPKGSRLAAYVSPGDSYPVAAVPIFRPGAGKGWSLPRLGLKPGENRVGMQGVVVRLGGGNEGEDVDLSTGYLDVHLPVPKK